MKQILCHLFLPHVSNNQRAKLLHHSTILLFVVGCLLGQFFLSTINTHYPAVLGENVDISTEQLLELTNKDRAEQNLPPLVLNQVLSKAASLKATYMFEQDFWAHNAPDGTTPWYFFKKAGYTYTYAGENLARGFTDSSEVVDAWMNSPTHRENMLSPNYREIGFAVKKGKLLGEDTILVVEMFGSTDTAPIAAAPNSRQKSVLPSAIDAQSVPAQNTLQTIAADYTVKTTALLNSRTITSSIGLVLLGVFMTVLLLDLILIGRKKIVRVVGHNLDHFFFFGAIFIVMIVTLRGIVL
jgi:hypothetical protein